MFWLEKYKPKSLDEITSHKEVVEMLSVYTIESIPNLIIHGGIGHNKKTIAYALMKQLYGKYPELQQKSIEMDVNNTKIDVNYLESEEIIEICPSEYGFRDRHVVQNIIKEMAETRPVLSLFGEKKRAIKTLIIDQGEDLSRDAQAALRRTIEIFSGHFRIIILCTEISKLIEPIISRCLLVRMRAFNDQELKEICLNILETESSNLKINVIDDIIANSNGNCIRALCMLEMVCFNASDSENKRTKLDMSKFCLEWESKINGIVELIRTSPKVDTMITIRKDFYGLLNSGISASTILLEMSRLLCKGSLDTMKNLMSFAMNFDERIRIGSKAIYHLEAFAAAAMYVLQQGK